MHGQKLFSSSGRVSLVFSYMFLAENVCFTYLFYLLAETVNQCLRSDTMFAKLLLFSSLG